MPPLHPVDAGKRAIKTGDTKETTAQHDTAPLLIITASKATPTGVGGYIG